MGTTKKKLYSDYKTFPTATKLGKPPTSGEPHEVENRLKNTVLTHIMTNETQSMGQSIVDSLLTGPRANLRRYEARVKSTGLATSLGWKSPSVAEVTSTNLYQLGVYISGEVSKDIYIDTFEISKWSVTFYGEQWMQANHPSDLTTKDIGYDYDSQLEVINVLELPNGAIADEPIVLYTFTPATLPSSTDKLYVIGLEVTGRSVIPLYTGPIVDIASEVDFPVVPMESTTISYIPKTFSLVTTVTAVSTYDDGVTPTATVGPTTTTASETHDEVSKVYTTLTELDDSPLTVNVSTFTHSTGRKIETITTTTVNTYSIGGGYTCTETTTTVQDVLVPRYYLQNTLYKEILSLSGSRVFYSYTKATGNSFLDTYFTTNTLMTEALPPLPFKLRGGWVDGPGIDPELYKSIVKCGDAILGRKGYENALAGFKDQPDGDLRHIHIVPSIPLNVDTKEGVRYIIEYFNALCDMKSSVMLYDTNLSYSSDYLGSYYYRLHFEVVFKEQSLVPLTMAQIRSKIDTVLFWNTTVDTFTLDKEINFKNVSKRVYNSKYIVNLISGPQNYEEKVLVVSRKKPSGEYLTFIIRGVESAMAVSSGTRVAGKFKTYSENSTEVYLPLHPNLLRKIGGINGNQLCAWTPYYSMQSYVLVSTHWLKRKSVVTVIQLVLIIVAILVTAFADWSGSLGSTIITAAFGITTGVIYAIAVFLVNAIAAYLISKIIFAVETAVHGEKIGTILADIATIVLTTIFVYNFANPSAVFQSMATPLGILNISSAIVDVYVNNLHMRTANIEGKSQVEKDRIESKIDDIQKLTEELLGKGSTSLEQMLLSNITVERPQQFLDRTLLTGYDNARIAISCIDNFTGITVNTDLPLLT